MMVPNLFVRCDDICFDVCLTASRLCKDTSADDALNFRGCLLKDELLVLAVWAFNLQKLAPVFAG